MRLDIQYATGRSSAAALKRIHARMVSKIAELWPGSVPEIIPLASVDEIKVHGVGVFNPEQIKTLRRICWFDYMLCEDVLQLFVFRDQRNRCCICTRALIYFTFGCVAIWTALLYLHLPPLPVSLEL